MKKSSDNVVAVGCVGCVGLLVALPLTAVLRGFVLSVLWSWFVVPVFGVAALSIPLAMGLALIVSMFTGSETIKIKPEKNRDKDKDKADESFASLITTSIFSMVGTPLLILGIGAIIRAFI